MGRQGLEAVPDFVLLSSRNRSDQDQDQERSELARPGAALPTSSGRSPCSLNLRGILLRAYLQPLKYMLHEHPKEKEAPHFSGSFPWHAHVRLRRDGEHQVNPKALFGCKNILFKYMHLTLLNI